VFILGLGVMILEGQRYVASMNYLEGINNWQQRGAVSSLEELQIKTNQTLEKLDRAIKINPKLDLYHREISQVYIQAINEVSSRTDLTQAEVIKLVQTYITNSVKATTNAVQINPGNIENWVVRGDVYKNLIGTVDGTKDFAVEAYEKASELEPNNPIYPTQAGVSIIIAINSGEYEDSKEELFDKAEEFFKKAISLKPDYSEANFQLAMLYKDQGKKQEMIAQLEKTKQSASNDSGLAFKIGLVYYQIQEFEMAKIEFERAIFISPNYANALYLLGLTYDELGNKEMAIVAFEQILVNNSDNELVSMILENLKAGRKALAGITEEEAVVPIEEE
jgi:tetratricopeptide (TPR) repeat protein